MERNADGTEARPLVGVGIYIFDNQGRVLLGKRKSAHAEGEYTALGGHLEFGETFEEACKKEAKEEADLDIGAVGLFNVENNLRYAKTHKKHYVSLSFKAEYRGGEPKAMEPDKCESWDWYYLDRLPSPLAEFTETALNKLQARE